MEKKLVRLDEYNRVRGGSYVDASVPHTNGIACPECGKELWDSSPGVLLASLPPKANVHCPGCGYRGYRVA